jgi:hypothetical protein
VRDKDDYNNVRKVLLDNFEFIYEQYVFGQGSSNFPTVSMLDFSKMCRYWKAISKSLTVTDVDRLFYAVNFEEVQGQQGALEDNPDQELCRYEFFEIIVRMAKSKYENLKMKIPIAEMLKKLLEDFIFQYKLEQPWHSFR